VIHAHSKNSKIRGREWAEKKEESKKPHFAIKGKERKIISRRLNLLLNGGEESNGRHTPKNIGKMISGYTTRVKGIKSRQIWRVAHRAEEKSYSPENTQKPAKRVFTKGAEPKAPGLEEQDSNKTTGKKKESWKEGTDGTNFRIGSVVRDVVRHGIRVPGGG